MIKITHISYSFGKGGASKAASNIINCLARKNFDIKKYSITNLWKNSKINFMKFLLINLFFRLIIRKKKNSFNLFDLYHKDTNIKNSDILHLHWIGNEFFSLKQIIRNNKKIIWTVHDDWLRNYTQHIGTQKKRFNFLENFFIKKVQRIKKKIYAKNITFVAPSKYIQKNLEKLIKKKIYLIQHPIDEKIFRFKKKKENKDLTFNLGGSNVFSDKNKGADIINNIIKVTKNKTNHKYKFIFFGSNDYDYQYQNDRNIKLMSFKKPFEVANIFHKSSFSFVLSEIESFSLIAAESLMCGCPVICFEKNAVSELITHKKNGYILKDKNLGDYQDFIKWIYKNPNHYNRKLIALDAKKKFSFKIISKKYAELYNAK